MHSFAGIFHILFSPLTNVSILMPNFTELMAADDYFNLILPKCGACKCLLNMRNIREYIGLLMSENNKLKTKLFYIKLL